MTKSSSNWRLALIILIMISGRTLYANDLIHEDEFAERFKSEVIPFWESGEAGFQTASSQKTLFGKKDVKLAYKTFFQEGAKGNVFIVHGYNNFKEMFRELAYDFYSEGFNVIAYDLRGHGRSTRLSDNVKNVYFDSYEKQAEDLKILINKFGNNNLKNFVYSFSMGGLITGLAIQGDSQLVSGVVMAAPLLGIDTNPYPKPVALGIAAAATAIGMGDKLAPGQSGPTGEPGSFETAQNQSLARWTELTNYKFDPLNVNEVDISGATNNWVYQTLKTAAKVLNPKNASKSTTPVLMFQAENDTVVLLPDQNAYCSALGNCELRFLPNARHFVSDEKDEIRIPLVSETIQFFESFLD